MRGARYFSGSLFISSERMAPASVPESSVLAGAAAASAMLRSVRRRSMDSDLALEATR